MKKLLAISFLLVLGLSVFPVTDVFGDAAEEKHEIEFGVEDKQIGTFCKVEKVDVCVLAMTEEDCTKLGGEKADSCSTPEEAEDKGRYFDIK